MQIGAKEAKRRTEPEAWEQKKPMAQRKPEFCETYKDWISVQNDLVDRIGVFGEEFRPW